MGGVFFTQAINGNAEIYAQTHRKGAAGPALVTDAVEAH